VEAVLDRLLRGTDGLHDVRAIAAVLARSRLYAACPAAEGWTKLAAKRGQLLGRFTRLRLRPSGQLDDDGNPVPVRRHHPGEPRRTRARRFVVR
jgi:hypothetical protein